MTIQQQSINTIITATIATINVLLSSPSIKTFNQINRKHIRIRMYRLANIQGLPVYNNCKTKPTYLTNKFKAM